MKVIRYTIFLLIAICLFYRPLVAEPAEEWNQYTVKESNFQYGNSDKFTQRIFRIIQSESTEGLVKHTGSVEETVFLKSKYLIVQDQEAKKYIIPNYIFSNVDNIQIGDMVNIYTLFNVVFYVSKLNRTSDRTFTNLSPPTTQQARQAIITASVYETNIVNSESFNVHIVGNRKLFKLLSAFEGQPIGGATLSEVTRGDYLPDDSPSIMFISQTNTELNKINSYCNDNGVLSITDNPEYFDEGISISIGILGGQIRLILDMKSSNQEGRNWKGKNIFYEVLN